MLSALRHQSIKTKLSLLSLTVAMVALTASTLAFILVSNTLFRQSLEEKMDTLGQVVGRNSTAAMVFNDPKAAAETLGYQPNRSAQRLTGATGNLIGAVVGPNASGVERDRLVELVACCIQIIAGEDVGVLNLRVQGPVVCRAVRRDPGLALTHPDGGGRTV